MSATGIGAAVRRKEDHRFITGKGHYTDDINRPGQSYAFFVRSPHAHATIKSIDSKTAAGMPGVLAVLAGADLAADKIGNLICGWMIHSKDGSPMKMAPHPALANSKACHVGDPVAVVIAETLAQAAKVKVDVVSRDEREAGLRRVLNLGHTFAHALEEASGYRRFLHGEAVGWGMLIVLRLAELLDAIEPAESRRIARLVRQIGPLPGLQGLSVRRIINLLPQDKKAVGGRIHWVIPERIGKVRINDQVPMHIAETAFREVQRGG